MIFSFLNSFIGKISVSASGNVKGIGVTGVVLALWGLGPSTAVADEMATPSSGTLYLPFDKPIPINIVLDEVESQTGVKIQARGKAIELKLGLAKTHFTNVQGFLMELEYATTVPPVTRFMTRRTTNGFEVWDYASWSAPPVCTYSYNDLPWHVKLRTKLYWARETIKQCLPSHSAVSVGTPVSTGIGSPRTSSTLTVASTKLPLTE